MATKKNNSYNCKNSNDYNPVQYVFNYKGVEELKKTEIKVKQSEKKS